MSIRATIDDAEVLAALKRVKKALTNRARPMKEVARVLDRYVRDCWTNQASPWGVQWDELKPSTLQGRQRAQNFSEQKLYDTGALFGSIKAESDGESATVSAGDGLEGDYARVHQFGNPTNTAWGGALAPIPARPFFPMRNESEVAFPAEWLRAVYAPLELALQEAVK